MVVTNLKLSVSKLPNNLLAGESVKIEAALLEGGKTIQRADFLKLVDFKLSQHLPDKTHVLDALEDKGFAPDARAGDGVYSKYLDDLSIPGIYELSVVADGKTFQRQSKHTINVLGSPLVIVQQETDKGVMVTATPVADVVIPDTVSMSVRMPESNEELALSLDGGALHHEFPASEAGKTLQFMATGKLISGKPFTSRQSLKLKGAPPAPVVKAEPAKEEPVVEPAVEKAPEAQPESMERAAPAEPEATEKAARPEAEAAVQEEDQGINWLVLMMWLVGGNAVVIGGVWFGYRFWQRKAGLADADYLELDQEEAVTAVDTRADTQVVEEQEQLPEQEEPAAQSEGLAAEPLSLEDAFVEDSESAEENNVTADAGDVQNAVEADSDANEAVATRQDAIVDEDKEVESAEAVVEETLTPVALDEESLTDTVPAGDSEPLVEDAEATAVDAVSDELPELTEVAENTATEETKTEGPENDTQDTRTEISEEEIAALMDEADELLGQDPVNKSEKADA